VHREENLTKNCLKIWEPQPSGTLRAYANLYSDCFNFVLYFFYYSYDFVLHSVHDTLKKTLFTLHLLLGQPPY